MESRRWRNINREGEESRGGESDIMQDDPKEERGSDGSTSKSGGAESNGAVFLVGEEVQSKAGHKHCNVCGVLGPKLRILEIIRRSNEVRV